MGILSFKISHLKICPSWDYNLNHGNLQHHLQRQKKLNPVLDKHVPKANVYFQIKYPANLNTEVYCQCVNKPSKNVKGRDECLAGT